MLRAAAFVLALAALPAAAQQDQSQTLADIRQQLSVLQVEMQGLRRELSTTGAPTVGAGGSTLPDRVDAIETELQRLTQAAERMEFRIESVSRDGGARIEDLRFQLCELTPDCTLDGLPNPGPLGGTESASSDVGIGAAPAPVPEPGPGPSAVIDPQLAAGEQAAFDAGRTALDSGDNAGAAEAFERFLGSYPTGPLTGEAQFLRGRALAAQGRNEEAARAYLEAFSGTPEGPRAPDALLGLGTTLGALDQPDEACLTLAEVAIRFPQSPAVGEAASARAGLGCQ